MALIRMSPVTVNNQPVTNPVLEMLLLLFGASLLVATGFIFPEYMTIRISPLYPHHDLPHLQLFVFGPTITMLVANAVLSLTRILGQKKLVVLRILAWTTIAGAVIWFVVGWF